MFWMSVYATVDKHEHVYVSPLLGGLALVGGVGGCPSFS
jgi:hypothetical protein